MIYSLETTEIINCIKQRVEDPETARERDAVSELHKAARSMSDFLLGLELENVDRADQGIIEASQNTNGQPSKNIVLTYGPRLAFINSYWPVELKITRTITHLGKNIVNPEDEIYVGGTYRMEIPHIEPIAKPTPQFKDVQGRDADALANLHVGIISPIFNPLSEEHILRTTSLGVIKYSRGLLALIGKEPKV